MKKLMMTVMVAFSAAVCVAADAAKDAKPAEKATDADAKEKLERRAKRAVKNAISLFDQKEDERAVGILEAVGRMYAETDSKYLANLALGRHFLDKRDFDRAGAELRTAQRSPDQAVQAESLLLQGQLRIFPNAVCHIVDDRFFRLHGVDRSLLFIRHDTRPSFFQAILQKGTHGTCVPCMG